MSGANEVDRRRRHSRKQNPFKTSSPPVITVNMPGLTAFPLAPEDFHEAGFKAVLPVPAEVGEVYPCAIHVRESVAHGFLARVAWVKEIRGLPPAWEVGFALEISDLEQGELESLLRAAVATNGSSM